MISRYYFFLLFVLISVNVQAQTVLTIDDALSIALKKSNTILSAKLSLLGSQKDFQAVKKGLLPTLNVDLDLPRYNRVLSSQFNPLSGSDQFYSIGNTTVEGRMSINQPIWFTNGSLYITGSLFGRDQFSGMTGTTRDYFSNISIQLRQPLFILNSQRTSLERAEINQEKAQRRYSQNERDLIYSVTVAFYNLYKNKKSVEISEEKVKQTEESYNTAIKKYNDGMIAEVEALQLDVDFAASKNELLNVQLQYEAAKNDFKLLIGLNINEIIDVTAELEYSPVDLDADDSVKDALKNSPELQNAQSDLELGKITIDEVDSRKTIKAELNATYGLNKSDNILENIFNNFADSRSVSFTISVPFLDWGKNSLEVESAKAAYEATKLSNENQKNQIAKDVYATVNKINSAKARVEILLKSVKIAEKSYLISVERFKSGNITSFELSQMQLKLTNAKLDNLGAIIDYKLALAELERKTKKNICNN
ncbi:MAG: TolC family protein [Bacteroidetes bacterium]|nr:TolC family protein [Bacteroidota bacterium]